MSNQQEVTKMTNELKHTPGPWLWSEDETSPGYFLVKSKETNVCILQQRDSDMGMDTDPERDEAIANARLIAAAPEMSEAAQPFARYGEMLMGQQVRDDAVMVELFDLKVTVGDFRKLADAIAKAEGRL